MQTEEKKLDPRVKLTIVLCISFLGIIVKDIKALFQILIASLLISLFFKVNLKEIFTRLKKLLYVIVGIIIIQSIFSKQGTSLLAIGRLNLITSYGIEKALEFVLRIMIVVSSASLLTSSTSREIIQAFVQWGMPYELAFMVATAIRFLPIMTEEIKDSLTAIQLRGIDLKKIAFKERLKIYSYIFTPILIGSINKAEKLSMSIEMRAFRAYPRRTSYMTLEMSTLDYILIFTSILLTILFGVQYFYNIF